jgi:hypothetical protein
VRLCPSGDICCGHVQAYSIFLPSASPENAVSTGFNFIGPDLITFYETIGPELHYGKLNRGDDLPIHPSKTPVVEKA